MSHRILRSLRPQLACLLLIAAALMLPQHAAAASDPVSFTVSYHRVSPTEIDVTFTGRIESGWHVYAVNIPAGGPTAASFHFDKAENVVKSGPLRAGAGAVKRHDDMFQMDVEYYEHACSFTQRVRLTGPNYKAEGYLEYGACSSQACLPPSDVNFRLTGSDGPETAPAAAATPSVAAPVPADIAGVVSAQPAPVRGDTAAMTPAAKLTSADSTALMAPQTALLRSQNGGGDSDTMGLGMVFLLGLLGGFIALLTPCVWPVIPMTVSFFLHRSSDNRRRAVRDAVTYGLAIIVIYLSLGLIITAIYGANALNSLSTNAGFNIFFFLLLLLFAASFLGGFELTLPSSWGNSVSGRSRQASGLLSIFLMALTLVIVSFSCTGPIIGLLLVEASTGGGILAPAAGMLGFAIALALPFAIFALFPGIMKRMPHSGDWMDTVKVTLGFIELAFSLKFLSVADLAYGWHILDRETFLSLWIAIFLIMGLYLLGVINLHGPRRQGISVVRLFAGLASVAFAIYMVPGLWGAPLKAVSAFSPPMYTQDFRLGSEEVSADYRDYFEGMAASRATGKPVLLDFTGYGCVNCRKMEAAVWTDPRVRRMLRKKFILVSLYVDDKAPLPESREVIVGGRKRRMRTVGDKWSILQETKFGATAQPFYVAVNSDGVPLAGSYAYDENVSHFLGFLNRALDAASQAR